MMSSQKFLNGTPSLKVLSKRPQTAVSHVALHSASSFDRLKTLESRKGGAHTFGAISTYNKARSPKKNYKSKVNDLFFEATVDSRGIAIFSNIPKTWYTILANENDFFKSASKSVVLPQEAELEDVIDVYVPMERQDSYSTTIYMIKTGSKEAEKHATDTEEYEKDKDHQEQQKYHLFDNLELRAVLLQPYERKRHDDSKLEMSDDESDIDYEEEFDQTEDKNGMS